MGLRKSREARARAAKSWEVGRGAVGERRLLEEVEVVGGVWGRGGGGCGVLGGGGGRCFCCRLKCRCRSMGELKGGRMLGWKRFFGCRSLNRCRFVLRLLKRCVCVCVC